MLLAVSMTGEEITCELIVVLSTGLGIGPDNFIVAMRDRVGSCENCEGPVPQCFGSRMFFLHIDNAGCYFCTPVLDEFISSWLALFSHSPKARLLVLAVVCVPTVIQDGGANGKLWINFLLHLGMLRDLLMTTKTFGLATRTKLQEIHNDPTKITVLHIELAALMQVPHL